MLSGAIGFQILARRLGVELGKTYPKPIVDIKSSRQNALDAFAKTKIP